MVLDIKNHSSNNKNRIITCITEHIVTYRRHIRIELSNGRSRYAQSRTCMHT